MFVSIRSARVIAGMALALIPTAGSCDKVDGEVTAINGPELTQAVTDCTKKLGAGAWSMSVNQGTNAQPNLIYVCLTAADGKAGKYKPGDKYSQ